MTHIDANEIFFYNCRALLSEGEHRIHDTPLASKPRLHHLDAVKNVIVATHFFRVEMIQCGIANRKKVERTPLVGVAEIIGALDEVGDELFEKHGWIGRIRRVLEMGSEVLDPL